MLSIQTADVRPRPTRLGSVGLWLVGAIVVIGVVGLAFVVWRGHPGDVARQSPEPVPTGQVLPIDDKPRPRLATFDGCMPRGSGGDPELNSLKNRTDGAAWIPMSFARLAALDWPRTVEGRDRRDWPLLGRHSVDKWEGTPISVEGYIAWARESGAEATNCKRVDDQHVDWHIWLVGSSSEGRDQRGRSVVVETTPAVRANHRAWNLPQLRELGTSGARVRISGWLLLDPEHPDQLGQTRGSLWEIHPILRIEVQRGEAWVDLDSLPPSPHRRRR